MHFLSLLSLATVATATVLSEYDAAAKDQRSNLTAFDTINYECMDKNKSCEDTEPNWNKTNGSASLYFRAGFDDKGIPAAQVHKDVGYHRAEHHIYHGKTEVNKTYYMGYKVRWDKVGAGNGLFVFQFKAYHKPYAQGNENNVTGYANVPIVLSFKNNTNLLTLQVIQKPSADPDPAVRAKFQGKPVWSKEITFGSTYQFGIVINTSQGNEGFLQMYFNGTLVTMTDPFSSPVAGGKTQKLMGNFFPGGETGAADPKIGMYGGNDGVCDGYIYNFVLADTLAEIKRVAGIA